MLQDGAHAENLSAGQDEHTDANLPADPEHHLYGLPREEFTAARNAMAKELSKVGRADEAALVKNLRKPTVAAWAVDQLARRAPESVEALLELGARLHQAQQRALEGDASDLRAASRDEAALVPRLASAAADILRDAGHAPSPAVAEHISATLRAAALDPELQEALRRGVLAEDLEPAGFGGLEGLAPARPRERQKPKEKASADNDSLADARRQARKAEEEADRATRHAERLQRAALEAEEAARRAREDADEAADRAAALADAAQELRRRLPG